MAHQAPIIKKTKKSSYKPLCKLNEDNLTDLKRLEKPEYKAVFYHNTTARCNLQNKVNVWFRHHQHAMAVINRQQRAVCNLMCRVQRDKHRAKRTEYQRKQQEIRANMKRMQIELLQRRVIQKFRRNADNKMTARGLQSLAGLKLNAQLRQDTVTPECDDAKVGEEHAHTTAMLRSIANYAAIVSSNADSHNEDIVETIFKQDSTSQLQSSTLTQSNKNGLFSNAEARTELNHQEARDSKGNNGIDNKSAASTKSTKTVPFTESESAHFKDSASPGISRTGIYFSKTPANHYKAKSPTLIFQDEEPAGYNLINTGETDHSNDTESPVFMDSEEVRRNHSSTLLSPMRQFGLDSSSATPPPGCAYPHPKNITHESVPSRQTPTSAVINTTQKSDVGEQNVSLSPQLQTSHQTGTRSVPVKSRSPTLSPRFRPGSLPLRDVVSRDKAVADAREVLGADHEDWKDRAHPSVMRSSTSLAVQVREDRKRQARQRAELLDKEPLIQYYRSSRGTLQPLLTKTSRRQFSMPTGRLKHHQAKLLKDEQLKNQGRRHDIDNFFSDLFTRPIGQPKSQTQEDAPELESNHLELLLQKMRQRNRKETACVDWNSVEQLAKCQYLRLHHWDQAEGRPPTVKATSWAAVENQMREGLFRSSV